MHASIINIIPPYIGNIIYNYYIFLIININCTILKHQWQAHLETASYAGLRNSRRKSLKLPLDFRS